MNDVIKDETEILDYELYFKHKKVTIQQHKIHFSTTNPHNCYHRVSPLSHYNIIIK